jgi:sigma-54 specific flagellar transcriptional regulator A
MTEEVPQLLASMAGDDSDDDETLPSGIWAMGDETPTRLPENGVDLRAHLTLIERSLISQALERSGGTVAHAARLLSLRRTTLVEKLRKLGMASGHESL